MTDWKTTIGCTEEEAKTFIGKHLLVGLTHCNLDGQISSREEFHGIIDRINPQEGIVIKLNGSNAEKALPPDVTQLKMTRPGHYKLQSTGEVVIDPDFTAMWTQYPKGYKS